jgi:uncharacterized protein
MKKALAQKNLRSFIAILVLFLAGSTAFSQATIPAPTGHVNDFAGVMDAATKQQLETRLREFKEKSNPQVEIAVAIVDTTGDRPIFDYSLQMAREWKIGSKEDDNPGALLLVAISDRKYYTQVSRNLEDELPDGIAGQLQRQYLVPEFKKGNYSKGIADTIDAYIKTIEAKQSGTAPPSAAKTPAPAGTGNSGRGLFSGGCSFIVCLIVIGVILLIIFSNFNRRGRKGRDDHDRWGGGSGGDSVLPWVAGAVIGNILSGSSSGSSSSSDWGGSSGGGSDWGGFGGGGDFGGGGAGGDW